jgi:peptide/nickel transport system substrate-binding protein
VTSERNSRRGIGQFRLSRRQGLKATAFGVAGIAATALTGCAPAPQPQSQTSTASPQAKKGGVVSAVLHPQAYPGGFDTQTAPQSWSMAYRLFYETLLDYDLHTLEIKPEIAEKWEQPSPSELIFTIRSGVKFHNKPPANGRALTANDVVFSLNRVRTDEPRFANRSLLSTVDRIQAVGENQIKLTMKQPDAGMLFKFGAECMAMMAPELLEQTDKLTTAEHAIGTGPFVMQSYNPGVGADFVRNPAYWDASLPYLDGVRFGQFADDLTAYSALRAGQLQISNVPPTEAQRYISSRGADYKPELAPQTTVDQIMYPNLKLAQFQDKRVTRALRLLVDFEQYRAVQRTVYGDSRYSQAFPSAMSAWDLNPEEYSNYIFWKQPKDDALREARSLLTAAGYSQSNQLKFEVVGYKTPEYEPIHQFIQDQWRRNSQGAVETTFNTNDVAVTIQRQVQGNWEYHHGGQGTPFIEPGVTFRTIYGTGGARNYAGFTDSKLDDLIDRSSQEFDSTRRKALVREALIHMIEAYPGQVTGTYYRLKGTSAQLRNYVPEIGSTSGIIFKSLWLDT